MTRQTIHTTLAPQAIGTYSQAVRVDDTVYISGQIPTDPATGELVTGEMRLQAQRAFENLRAIAMAAGGDLDDAVHVTIYLIDLKHFAVVNETMAQYFLEPYPARVTVAVAALPRGAQIEVDSILVLRADARGVA
jgi:reactive intermediate/imine deaminase